MPELINQRTMLRPGEGIVPPGQPTQQHQEYPKHMRHPGFAPAEVGDKVKFGDPDGPGFVYHRGGKPARYPPVLVRGRDDEEYHLSQGYETIGSCTPEAFARLVQSTAPPIENHVAVEYPKWVGGKLVKSAEEEAALTGKTMSPDAASAEPALNVEMNALEGVTTDHVDRVAARAADEEIAALEAKLAALKAKKAAPDGLGIGFVSGPVEAVVVPATDTHIAHVEFVSTEEVVTLDTGEMVRREKTAPTAEDVIQGTAIMDAVAAEVAQQPPPLTEKETARLARNAAIKAGIARRKVERAAAAAKEANAT